MGGVEHTPVVHHAIAVHVVIHTIIYEGGSW